MKKELLLLALPLTLVSCAEKPILIPELSVGSRVVLVEEMTGVNCPNCPDGTLELQALQQNIGKDNLVLVAIHSSLTGAFSTLLPTSKEDFRTAEIDNLVNNIGSVEQVPSAAVNRVEKPGETTLFLGRTNWNALINAQLQRSPQLAVLLNTAFQLDTRILSINVNLAPDNTLEGDHRLTVYITQDSILDAQNIKGVKEPNYMHRHVLRDVVSSTNGDLITEKLVGGGLVQRSYQVNIPAQWDARHCSVVAFVHRGSGFNNKEVLQVAEKYILK
jgi:hypothetical protein